jgi:hypothetical protein
MIPNQDFTLHMEEHDLNNPISDCDHCPEALFSVANRKAYNLKLRDIAWNLYDQREITFNDYTHYCDTLGVLYF